MFDLIVVGGGPAGITASVYALRKQLDVCLLSQDLGGKINYQMALADRSTESVIRGLEVVEQFWQELDQSAHERRLEPVSRITRGPDAIFTAVTESGQQIQGRSVVLATGARIKPLGIPGERQYVGRGLSYSAISYAQLFRDKDVAVVGDGRHALRAALELSQLASRIHLITESRELLASPLAGRLANSLKAIVWEGHRIRTIEGNGYVTGLILQAPDGAKTSVRVDGLFVELGIAPNSEPVRDLVECDAHGHVLIDLQCRTNCPGLFAAGDVTNVCTEQVVVAVGDGAKAALSAFDYLLEHL